MLKVLVVKKYSQKSFRKTSLLFIHQTSIGYMASHGIFLLLLRRDWHAGRLVHKQALDGFKCGCSGDACQLQQEPRTCLRLCSPRSRSRDKGLRAGSYLGDDLRMHSWGIGEMRQEKEAYTTGATGA